MSTLLLGLFLCFSVFCMISPLLDKWTESNIVSLLGERVVGSVVGAGSYDASWENNQIRYLNI